MFWYTSATPPQQHQQQQQSRLSEEYIHELVTEADARFAERDYKMAQRLYAAALETSDRMDSFERSLISADLALVDRLKRNRAVVSAKQQIAGFGLKVTQLQSDARAP